MLYNPDISDNRIDNSFPTSPIILDAISNTLSKPVLTSTVSIVTELGLDNNKTLERLPVTSKKPLISSSQKYSLLQIEAFATTLGPVLKKNLTTTLSFKDKMSTKDCKECLSCSNNN